MSCSARYSRSSTRPPRINSIIKTRFLASKTWAVCVLSVNNHGVSALNSVRIYNDVRIFMKSSSARLAFLASCRKFISFGRFSRISLPSHVSSNSGNSLLIQPRHRVTTVSNTKKVNANPVKLQPSPYQYYKIRLGGGAATEDGP